MGRKGDAMTTLAIAGFIHDEHASAVGTQCRMRPPEGQPARIEGGSVPGGVVQEVMELLPVAPRNQGGEHGHGLVVVSGQEQAHQIVPKGLACGQPIEEIIELGTEDVNRVSGRDGGFAGRRHGRSPVVQGRIRERYPKPTPRPDQPALMLHSSKRVHKVRMQEARYKRCGTEMCMAVMEAQQAWQGGRNSAPCHGRWGVA